MSPTRCARSTSSGIASPCSRMGPRSRAWTAARPAGRGGAGLAPHKVREIAELGDRITVFKDGAKVACLDRGAAGSEELVRLMVGRQFAEMFPPKNRQPGAVVLQVKGLTSAAVHHVSL